MRFSTLTGFLIGRRESIQEVATHPHALKIGLAFVLLAGLAREHDQEDLLHEPWHVLLPLAISSALAFVFALIAWIMRPIEDMRRPPISTSIGMFLRLFWFISPMAVLYAVPYERFLDAGGATQMNLITLALVSSWRVLLLSRVLVVTLGIDGFRAFALVMVVADALALAGLMIVPLPLFQVMGGMRLSESEQMIASATMCVSTLGLLTFPIWALVALVSLFVLRIDWRLVQSNASDTGPRTASTGNLGWIAFALLAIAAAVLPFSQPPQQRRWLAEKLLREQRFGDAVTFMSGLDASDFPPHWDPPPRVGYREREPDPAQVVRALVQQSSADWVRRSYLSKLDARLRLDIAGMAFDLDWRRIENMNDDADHRSKQRVRERLDDLELLLTASDRLTDDDRAAIKTIMDRAASQSSAN